LSGTEGLLGLLLATQKTNAATAS